MNMRDRFRELRRSLADTTDRRANWHRPTAKPQQLEFSLPLIRRSRALRLNPSATR